MENDTISRRAAIDAVRKNTFRLTVAEEQNGEGHVAWSAEAVYSDVMEGALLELPSAQPKRKTGKWIRIYSRPNVFADLCWHCTNCGAKLADQWANKYRFCPDCGAEMEVNSEAD